MFVYLVIRNKSYIPYYRITSEHVLICPEKEIAQKEIEKIKQRKKEALLELKIHTSNLISENTKFLMMQNLANKYKISIEELSNDYNISYEIEEIYFVSTKN